MHRNSSFWAQKSKKSGEGAQPLPTGEGNTLSTPYPLGAFGASILPPTALETHAFGTRHSLAPSALVPPAFPVSLPVVPDLGVQAETLVQPTLDPSAETSLISPMRHFNDSTSKRILDLSTSVLKVRNTWVKVEWAEREKECHLHKGGGQGKEIRVLRKVM